MLDLTLLHYVLMYFVILSFSRQRVSILSGFSRVLSVPLYINVLYSNLSYKKGRPLPLGDEGLRGREGEREREGDDRTGGSGMGVNISFT